MGLVIALFFFVFLAHAVQQRSSAIMDAPIGVVWSILSPFDDMARWYKVFTAVNVLSGRPNEAGAIRQCEMRDGKYVKEKLLYFSSNDFNYSYSMLPYDNPSNNPLPIRIFNHRADVSLTAIVSDLGKGATLVQWTISFDTDPGQEVIAEKINLSLFSALFKSLDSFLKNHSSSKADDGFFLRRACLFDVGVTVERILAVYNAKEARAHSPLFSSIFQPNGDQSRSFHRGWRLEETVQIPLLSRYRHEALVEHEGERAVITVAHGDYSNRTALVFRDNFRFQKIDESNRAWVMNITHETCKFLEEEARLDFDNPCCGFPCGVNGVCVRIGSGYECDCLPGFYGQNCSRKSLSQWFRDLFSPDVQEYLQTSWFMTLFNNFEALSRFLMKIAVSAKLRRALVPVPYSTSHPYKTMEGLLNSSYYGRILPPIPVNCPCAAGSVGPVEYPSVDEVLEKFLRRRSFVRSSTNTSVLLAVYAQHFTHQFFKTDPRLAHAGFTQTQHYVDLNQVYGADVTTQHLLREHAGGRMKMRKHNGAEFPPFLSDLPLVPTLKSFGRYKLNESNALALGHPLLTIFPGLSALSTIWLREHNRVAGLLAGAHPTWGDEQLFQTTRMVLTIICMRITVEDYVGENLAKSLFKFRFFPDLMHNSGIQWQNRIALEFNHLYHWHPLLPDYYIIGSENLTEAEMLFNVDILFRHDAGGLLDAFSRQIAGEANGPNFSPVGLAVARQVILYGRSLRLQSLNAYRQTVGLAKYQRFEEFSDDPSTVESLKRLYQHPDAVEMFPGMFIEKRREGGLFGSTITHRGIPSTFQGIFGHPLLSEEYWLPSTFGGTIGWKLVNEPVTLEQLIVRNTKSERTPRGKMNVNDKLPPPDITVGFVVSVGVVLFTIAAFIWKKK